MNKLSGRCLGLAWRIEAMGFFVCSNATKTPPHATVAEYHRRARRAGDGKVRNEMRCRADGALYVAAAIADVCVHAG